MACSEPEPVAPPPAPPVQQAALDPKVARAVELAQAVTTSPAGGAEAALAAKQGSREELEGLLYEIAADPTLTDAYAKAMGR